MGVKPVKRHINFKPMRTYYVQHTFSTLHAFFLYRPNYR